VLQTATGTPAWRATLKSLAVFSSARMTSGAPPRGYCGSVKPSWKSTTTIPGFSPVPTGIAP
jgi:hypothetical protein